MKLTKENVMEMLKAIDRALVDIMPMAIGFYKIFDDAVVLDGIFYSVVRELRHHREKYPEAYKAARLLWRKACIDFEHLEVPPGAYFYYYVTFEE